MKFYIGVENLNILNMIRIFTVLQSNCFGILIYILEKLYTFIHNLGVYFNVFTTPI